MASRTQNSYDALAALREKSSEHLPDMQVTVLDETGEEELVLTVLDEYKTLYNKNRSLIVPDAYGRHNSACCKKQSALQIPAP